MTTRSGGAPYGHDLRVPTARPHLPGPVLATARLSAEWSLVRQRPSIEKAVIAKIELPKAKLVGLVTSGHLTDGRAVVTTGPKQCKSADYDLILWSRASIRVISDRLVLLVVHGKLVSHHEIGIRRCKRAILSRDSTFYSLATSVGTGVGRRSAVRSAASGQPKTERPKVAKLLIGKLVNCLNASVEPTADRLTSVHLAEGRAVIC